MVRRSGRTGPVATRKKYLKHTGSRDGSRTHKMTMNVDVGRSPLLKTGGLGGMSIPLQCSRILKYNKEMRTPSDIGY